jgi:hypothetical protein
MSLGISRYLRLCAGQAKNCLLDGDLDTSHTLPGNGFLHSLAQPRLGSSKENSKDSIAYRLWITSLLSYTSMTYRAHLAPSVRLLPESVLGLTETVQPLPGIRPGELQPSHPAVRKLQPPFRSTVRRRQARWNGAGCVPERPRERVMAQPNRPMSRFYSAVVPAQNNAVARNVRHLTDASAVFLTSVDASLSIRSWT